MQLVEHQISAGLAPHGRARDSSIPGEQQLTSQSTLSLQSTPNAGQRALAWRCRPANSEAMQLHLDEIATKVTPGAHAMLLLDQARGGMAPPCSACHATSRSCHRHRARPNSRDRKTSGSSCARTGRRTGVFKSCDDIVDHCCFAWNTLIGQPWKIMSLARRDWAHVGYSI